MLSDSNRIYHWPRHLVPRSALRPQSPPPLSDPSILLPLSTLASFFAHHPNRFNCFLFARSLSSELVHRGRGRHVKQADAPLRYKPFPRNHNHFLACTLLLPLTYISRYVRHSCKSHPSTLPYGALVAFHQPYMVPPVGHLIAYSSFYIFNPPFFLPFYIPETPTPFTLQNYFHNLKLF